MNVGLRLLGSALRGGAATTGRLRRGAGACRGIHRGRRSGRERRRGVPRAPGPARAGAAVRRRRPHSRPRRARRWPARASVTIRAPKRSFTHCSTKRFGATNLSPSPSFRQESGCIHVSELLGRQLALEGREAGGPRVGLGSGGHGAGGGRRLEVGGWSVQGALLRQAGRTTGMKARGLWIVVACAPVIHSARAMVRGVGAGGVRAVGKRGSDRSHPRGRADDRQRPP